ncbi:MAG TPA: hypothetical protein VGS21_09580, partial [Acidimicrobiales bacterium]|nr:hypothetical protein [Acidimicrobiales bacterium]
MGTGAMLVAGVGMVSPGLASASPTGVGARAVNAPHPLAAPNHTPPAQHAAATPVRHISHLPFLSSTPRRPEGAVHRTFTVDSSGDATSGTSCASGHAAGTCTLRAAVAAADADTGNTDAVDIPAGTHVVLTQDSTVFLDNSMYINGAGASVSGNNAAEIFDLYSYASVWITGLTLEDAHETNDGGAIYCDDGSLVLSGVTVTHNVAGYGAGVYGYSYCTVWINDSTFTDNVATGTVVASQVGRAPTGLAANGSGGGVYLDGQSYISRSTFGGSSSAAGNEAEYGAGIYIEGGTAVLTDILSSHNFTTEYGYGVGIYNDGVTQLSDSTITGNASAFGAEGVGLYNESNFLAHDVLIAGNTCSGSSTCDAAGYYDDGDTVNDSNLTITGNSCTPGLDEDCYGTAAYIEASDFTWTGGVISNTRNGSGGSTYDYIEGGAIYAEGSNARFSDISISYTTNNAGASEGIEGGVIYNDDYTHFDNLSISNTINNGYYIYGGIVYNSDYLSMDNLGVTDTTNTATHPTGEAYVYGGDVYNDDYYLLNHGSFSSTSSTVRGLASSSNYIEGGAWYNSDYGNLDDVSFWNTTAVVHGNEGYVYGGGVYN